MSSYEEKVSEILHKNHITYVREKTFEDLKHGLYRFDFYLPALNVCIEVNGEQHYTYSKLFYKKKSDFLKAQERDRRKISYCLAQKIKLYIIPYWDIESLTKSSDLFKTQYLATSKFHNDLAYKKYRQN